MDAIILVRLIIPILILSHFSYLSNSEIYAPRHAQWDIIMDIVYVDILTGENLSSIYVANMDLIY